MGSKIPKGVSCRRMLTLWIRTNVVLALIAAGLSVNCCVSANERVSFELTLKDALWSPGRAWWVVQLGIATGQGTQYLFGPKILHYIYIYYSCIYDNIILSHHIYLQVYIYIYAYLHIIHMMRKYMAFIWKNFARQSFVEMQPVDIPSPRVVA